MFTIYLSSSLSSFDNQLTYFFALIINLIRFYFCRKIVCYNYDKNLMLLHTYLISFTIFFSPLFLQLSTGIFQWMLKNSTFYFCSILVFVYLCVTIDFLGLQITIIIHHLHYLHFKDFFFFLMNLVKMDLVKFLLIFQDSLIQNLRILLN